MQTGGPADNRGRCRPRPMQTTALADNRDMALESSSARRPVPPRLALTIEEAARAVGMSESSFKRHVQAELRIVRRGSLRIVPVSEIERWLESNATLAGATKAGSRMTRASKRPRAVAPAGGMAHREVAP
jgi:AraC-like DNA-binding protein